MNYVKSPVKNVVIVSKLVTLHYFELGPEFRFAGERHDFWEMVYIDSGSAVVTAEEDELRLSQGQLIFHHPNEFHAIRSNGDIRAAVFIITFECRSPAMHPFERSLFTLPSELKSLISAMIDEGRRAYDLPFFDPYLSELVPREDAPVGAQQMLRIYLESFLIMLLRKDIPRRDEGGSLRFTQLYDDPLVAEVIRFLEENLCRRISMADVCAEIGYGRTHVSEKFRTVTGHGVMEYFTILKIAEAKRLLRERRRNVGEISELLAFESPQYFSRRFKELTGVSPAEYIRISANF